MSSDTRTLANQANAKLSTGPRTPEGKARSAQNATRHGLTGRHLVVRPDEREEFIAFRSELLAELDPQGALETVTFDELLHASWNLRRLRRLEADLGTDEFPDPLSDPWFSSKIDTIERYRSRARRAFYRALSELRTLQTNRALRAASLDPMSEPDIPAIADIRILTKQTHSGVTATAKDMASKMIGFETSICRDNSPAPNPACRL